MLTTHPKDLHYKNKRKKKKEENKKETKEHKANTTHERGELNAGLHIRLRFANRTALCQGGRQTSKSNQPVM